MKGGLGGLMKQAQKMQEAVMKAQQEVANLEVTGISGGGLVSVVMNGRHEVRRVTIDDSLLGDDKDMLEDLIVAACNDAVQRIDAASKEKMSGLAAMMPPGLNLPF